jgi:hypothetical protein
MKTTIITPTTGHPFLSDAMRSVASQNCKHLIVVDGRIHLPKVADIMHEIRNPDAELIVLPENTGFDGYICHRIYASIPMLVNTEFYAHLDEDNMIAPTFIERMESQIGNHPVLTCRRRVVRQDLSPIGYDDSESIGVNRMGYTLYDTNTYLIRQSLAYRIAPHIYGKHTTDRNLSEAVLPVAKHIQEYLSIYRAPERNYAFFEEICRK